MFYAQISDPTSAGEWITYIWLHGKHFKQSISLSNSTPSAFGGLLKQDIQPPQEWKTSVTDNFRSTQRSPPILLSNSNEPLQPQKGLLLKQGCDVYLQQSQKTYILRQRHWSWQLLLSNTSNIFVNHIFLIFSLFFCVLLARIVLWKLLACKLGGVMSETPNQSCGFVRRKDLLRL